MLPVMGAPLRLVGVTVTVKTAFVGPLSLPSVVLAIETE